MAEYRLRGPDISQFQGNIDWGALCGAVDFVIMRCGWGDDETWQDDPKYATNVKSAETYGVPYAIYLYSYINNEYHLQSEISHALRMASGHNPFCIYLDVEEACCAAIGKQALTSYVLRWCAAIQNAGYKAGVYASAHWFDKYIDIYQIFNSGHSAWPAAWADTEVWRTWDQEGRSKPNWPGVSYDVWQFTSWGYGVSGITNRVDLNYMYNDIRNYSAPAPTPPAPTPPAPTPPVPVLEIPVIETPVTSDTIQGKIIVANTGTGATIDIQAEGPHTDDPTDEEPTNITLDIGTCYVPDGSNTEPQHFVLHYDFVTTLLQSGKINPEDLNMYKGNYNVTLYATMGNESSHETKESIPHLLVIGDSDINPKISGPQAPDVYTDNDPSDDGQTQKEYAVPNLYDDASVIGTDPADYDRREEDQP